jgi:hypothetical protein
MISILTISYIDIIGLNAASIPSMTGCLSLLLLLLIRVRIEHLDLRDHPVVSIYAFLAYVPVLHAMLLCVILNGSFAQLHPGLDPGAADVPHLIVILFLLFSFVQGT